MDEPRQVAWEPNPGPQTQFLESSTDEVLYGGSAGGGKTDSLLVAPLRWIHHPRFNGIIFRRTFPELEGQVIPRSRIIYPAAGGRYNSVQHCWMFPSGARIHFGHLQTADDVHRYQGWEFQYIGFDELTTFEESQYRYILSRLRSAHDIPQRVRSGSNPGGVGHEWVLARWAPWLDRSPEYRGPLAQPGQVMWAVHIDEAMHWVSVEEAQAINARWEEAPRGERDRMPRALSRVFIPAKLEDNRHLQGTGYSQTLDNLDPVTRRQLKHGDWMARPAAGMYFKRAWFDVVDALPGGLETRHARGWDLAATEGGGDWTCGVKMARDENGIFYVEDVVRMRGSPGRVEEEVRAAAMLDGIGVRIGLPQDPGQAGKAQVEYFVKQLAGYPIRSSPERGDKVTRAEPVSSQAEHRRIKLIRGPWNTAFLQELESFPEEGFPDDQVDAMSRAFSILALGQNRASHGDAAFKAPGFKFGHAELTGDSWDRDD